MNTSVFILPGWCLGRGPLETLAAGIDAQFIDLPGYGKQSLETDFDRAIQSIADELPSGAVLCGWSLGAIISLAIAARFPDKVGRLILIAGTASFVQREDWMHAMPVAALHEFTMAIAKDPEAMLPRFIGGFNRGDRQSKSVTQTLLAQADPRPDTSVLCTGLNWLATVDLRSELKSVQAPTLLIHGEFDPLMPLGAAETLRTLLPVATLQTMAGCAHAPFVSSHDDVMSTIRGFINAR